MLHSGVGKGKQTFKHHVHSSLVVKTDLPTRKLKVTKTGFTATRDKGCLKHVFSLDEMVGENSKHHFELKTWDGW